MGDQKCIILVSKKEAYGKERNRKEKKRKKGEIKPRYGFYDFWYGFYMESKDLMVLYGFLGIPNLRFS